MMQDRTYEELEKSGDLILEKRKSTIMRPTDDKDGTQWRKQSRMSTILLKVTRYNRTKVFIIGFLSFIVLISALTVSVIRYQRGRYDAFPMTFRKFTRRGDFLYPKKQNLMYPTCGLTDAVNIEKNSTGTAMLDYAFLSNLMYYDPHERQELFDNWFGPGVGSIDSNITEAFREKSDIPSSVGNYGVFTFHDTVSVIAIQGTSTAWVSPSQKYLFASYRYVDSDHLPYLLSNNEIRPCPLFHSRYQTEYQDWLVNAQLWLYVSLMELYLDLFPAGRLFHSILDDILRATRFLQNKRLEELRMTSHTTELVNYMMEFGGFDKSKLTLTGHSMGGGIALVTGAQTNIPAISLSGILSRA